MAAPSAPLNGHYNQPPPNSQAGSIMLAGSDAAYRVHNGPASTQSSYQMMTLETEQGPIQVPVDVQAASKMADEKRKRNAGASARFRARRKEKEREASSTISRLESKMREIVEEKEYYRMERDYFRDLVYNSPASAHVASRPLSPQQRKTSIAGGSDPSTDWQQNGERGSDDGRNQRRRINGYGEPAPPPASTASYPAPAMSSHAPQHGASQPYNYPRPGGPAPNQGPRSMGHAHSHYVPTAPPGYNHAWKPQVS
jgi:hypothetical protein